MLLGQKLVVILPAYNAEKTLARTYAEIPMDIVDEVVLVDDHSTDRTAEVGRELGIRIGIAGRLGGYATPRLPIHPSFD